MILSFSCSFSVSKRLTMKSVVILIFALFFGNIYAADEITEADVQRAKEHRTFLEKIAGECISETGVAAEEAQKILLGYSTDESKEAKVRAK